MFRIVSSTILLIAFAIQSFHMGGIVVDYYLNTSAYSKNCENKTKPVLKCIGKCQMAKKLVEAQKKNEKAPEQKSGNKIQVISFQSFYACLLFENRILTHTYNSYLVKSKRSPHLGGIFHPPCLA
jgi:hypothetical protein